MNDLLLIDDGLRGFLRVKCSKVVDFTNDILSDESIDKFIVEKLKPSLNTNTVIVIPISLGNEDVDFTGIRLAYHLRLTQQLKDFRRLPIIFVSSSETIEDILRSHSDLAKILVCKGSYFVDLINFETVSKKEYGMISQSIFDSSVIPKLQIPSDHSQSHSGRNKWGARLFEHITNNLEVVLEGSKSLFSKYLECSRDIISKDKAVIKIEKNKIKKASANFLLIDDNYALWQPVLSNFLGKKVDCVELESGDEYSEFDRKIKEKISLDKYDIIFLDLRLNKSEEGQNLNPEEYSGYKILQEIKQKNKGTQVIILTASNKAWNMKALLDAGADGYYVKEGPYDFEYNDSIANYNSLVDAVNRCGERVYLREVWNKIESLKKNIHTSLYFDGMSFTNIEEYNNFKSGVDNKLAITFNLLNQNETYRLAFLMLFQILEDYSNLSFIYEKELNDSFVYNEKRMKVKVYGKESRPNLAGNIFACIKFQSGKYSFQTAESENNPTFKVIFKEDSFKPKANTKHQTQETTLFRIIAILKERHSYMEGKCNQVLEFIYLRSNLCGHETGNIKPGIDITQTNVLNLISNLEGLFI